MQSKTGAQLHAQAIVPSGFRGLLLCEPSLTFLHAPFVFQMESPEARLTVDPMGLFRGKLALTSFVLDNATIRVQRLSVGNEGPGERGTLKQFRNRLAGRPCVISGRDCKLELSRLVGEETLTLENLDFYISTSPGTPEVQARLTGKLAGSTPQPLEAELTFTALDEFELRASSTDLEIADLAGLLSPAWRVLGSGNADVRLKLEANPEEPLIVEVKASLQEMSFSDTSPFPLPSSGTLTAQGAFEVATRSLTVNSARFQSNRGNAEARGAVDLGEGQPLCALQIVADRLPFQEIFDWFWQKRWGEYASASWNVDPQAEIALHLEGPLLNPNIEAHFGANAAQALVTAKDSRFPGGLLRFGLVEASWNSATSTPRAAFTILDGALEHERTGVAANEISGTVFLDGTRVSVKPLTGLINGGPFIGSGSYDLGTKAGQGTVAATLDRIENTPLGNAIKNVDLSGTASVNLQLTAEDGQYQATGLIDATHLTVGYRWWFMKPPGVGLKANVRAQLLPRKKISLRADVNALQTEGRAEYLLAHDGTRWRLSSIQADFDTVDILTWGRCLRVPYSVTGGKATDVVYQWRRGEADGASALASAKCRIDEVGLLAKNAVQPIRGKGIVLEAILSTGRENTAHVDLSASQCWTPPLGSPWFAPLDIDPELRAKYPPVKRTYFYMLSFDAIEAPPWNGTTFTGRAVTDAETTVLESYAADVGGGHIEGDYRRNRLENAHSVKAVWRDVPASYFLQHLHLPDVLSGPCTGEVEYFKDSDNPATLRGKGFFQITEGQFSADFFLFELGQRLSGQATLLPPAFRFSELYADVQFDSDQVRTPRARFLAEGVTLTGQGQFVMGGEMDYTLNASISPEAAEKIPSLKEMLSLEGHRLAKEDIELAFRVTGPVVSPRGELAQPPPVSVTLLTGGLEVVSDAVQVIDIPRKILLDLLRIGGTLMGMGEGPSQTPGE